MSASSTREGMLVLDLIDAKNKDLAWRLYLVRKIVKVDKDWKKRTRISAMGLRAICRRRNKLSKRKRAGEREANARTCNGRDDTAAFPGWWRE
jgi:hypothetical protein